MRTIRISYASKLDTTTDMEKIFVVGTKELTSKSIQGVHGVLVDDRTVDMLVPDNFDPSILGGTIITPSKGSPIHVFAGHEETKKIVDKSGTVQAVQK